MVIENGKLNIYIGCMFSGKSSEIIKECRRRLVIKQKVLGINYFNDNRYSDAEYIVNHNCEKIECIKVDKLSSIPEQTILNNDFIFIDEGQFYTDLVEYVTKWTDVYKKSVYVFGLDGDFQRQPFGQILNLIPYADNVVKLKALCCYCKDGAEGIFTHRITNSNQQVLIGVHDYVPVCRKHFNDLNNIK